MKYISAFIKLLFFFGVLVFLFLLAPLFANAETNTFVNTLNFHVSSNNRYISDPYIKYNNKYQELTFIDGEIPPLSEQMPPYSGYWGFNSNWNSSLDYNGMFYRMLVQSNSDLNFYNAPDELYIPINLNTDGLSVSEDYVNLTFQLYSECGFDISSDICAEVGPLRTGRISVELYDTVYFSSQYVITSPNKSYSCYTTNINDYSAAAVVCTIPRSSFVGSSAYKVLKLNLNSDIYRTYKPADGSDYYEEIYDIFLRDQYWFSGTEHAPHTLTVVPGKDSVSATINISDTSDVSKYCFGLSLPGGGEMEQCSESNEFTFSGLSNGEYQLSSYVVYTDNTMSTRVVEIFEITDSVIPVLNYSVYMGGYDDKLYVDLCGSYGVSAPIKSYFYQLDGGEWIQSDKCTHDFDVDGYGYYDVKVYVEDELGNQSIVGGTAMNFKDPQETNENFLEGIVETLDNFFNGFFDFVNKVLDPDTWFGVNSGYLNDWFSRMNMLFSEQFGFLAYPFTWILTFLQRLVEYQDTGHYIISWPDIAVPNFDTNIISAGSFDLATLLKNSTIATFHDLYFTCLNGLIILSFLNLCMNKINSVLGSHDVQVYEITSTTDSQSFTDRSSASSSLSVRNRIGQGNAGLSGSQSKTRSDGSSITTTTTRRRRIK